MQRYVRFKLGWKTLNYSLSLSFDSGGNMNKCTSTQFEVVNSSFYFHKYVAINFRISSGKIDRIYFWIIGKGRTELNEETNTVSYKMEFLRVVCCFVGFKSWQNRPKVNLLELNTPHRWILSKQLKWIYSHRNSVFIIFKRAM